MHQSPAATGTNFDDPTPSRRQLMPKAFKNKNLKFTVTFPRRKGPGSFAKIRVANADYYVEDGILVTRNVKKYQQRPAYRYHARPHVELGLLVSYDIAREMKLDGVWKEVVEASAATPRLAICNHEKC